VSNELESQLRNALRPVEPDAGFAERVAARIHDKGRDHGRYRRHWWAAALAASLVSGVVLLQHWQAGHEKALEARQQLIQALHLTSEKLDLAIRRVNDASRPSGPDDQGA
jgi:hypothetical protein